MTGEKAQADQSIERFYNSEAKAMAARHDKSGVHKTAIKQVMDILDAGSTSVIDVGSGPGSVMLEFLKNGIDKITGIDLSPEMNKTAKERISESGFPEDQFKLLDGSFLDLDSGDYDGVSMHRVICCHPDKQGMLEKCVSFEPKVISLTVPRTWKLYRVIIAIFGVFTRLNSSFRPYIHSQKYIDNQLKNKGYELVSRYKSWLWVQSTYRRINQS